MFLFWERFLTCLAGFKETLVLGGFSGSEVCFLRLWTPHACFFVRPWLLRFLFVRTHRSGVHLRCMSPDESEGRERWLRRRHALPSHLTCLFSFSFFFCRLDMLLVTTAVDGYRRYTAERLTLGPQEHSDTSDGRRMEHNNDNTDGASSQPSS